MRSPKRKAQYTVMVEGHRGRIQHVNPQMQPPRAFHPTLSDDPGAEAPMGPFEPQLPSMTPAANCPGQQQHEPWGTIELPVATAHSPRVGRHPALQKNTSVPFRNISAIHSAILCEVFRNISIIHGEGHPGIQGCPCPLCPNAFPWSFRACAACLSSRGPCPHNPHGLHGHTAPLSFHWHSNYRNLFRAVDCMSAHPAPQHGQAKATAFVGVC